jgi:hypothetical protein
VRAGDPVWIAPNERHWHGASSSTLMPHATTTIGVTQFHEAVTDAEHATANATPGLSTQWQLGEQSDLWHSGTGAFTYKRK